MADGNVLPYVSKPDSTSCNTIKNGKIVLYNQLPTLMLTSLTHEDISASADWLGADTFEVRLITAFYTPVSEIATFVEIQFAQVTTNIIFTNEILYRFSKISHCRVHLQKLHEKFYQLSSPGD